MRVVIPYRLSRDGEALELRYAIRSMYKHFVDMTGVLLIGDKPEWYCGDHIHATDIPHRKEFSMMRKVASCPDGHFMYSNDDFFALQDFTADGLPCYYEKTCADLLNSHRYGQYRRLYEACPGSWLNYDVHAPMLMERGQFKRSWHLMREDQPIKTMYMQGQRTDRSQYLADAKLKGEHTYRELKFHIKDRPFFSTSDDCINPDLIRLFNELYPYASPAEKCNRF